MPTNFVGYFEKLMRFQDVMQYLVTMVLANYLRSVVLQVGAQVHPARLASSGLEGRQGLQEQ